MKSNIFQIQGDMQYNNALLIFIVTYIFYLSPRIIFSVLLIKLLHFKCSWITAVLEMPEIFIQNFSVL
jgi:uncharacterized membrane protein YGL010W